MSVILLHKKEPKESSIQIGILRIWVEQAGTGKTFLVNKIINALKSQTNWFTSTTKGAQLIVNKLITLHIATQK